MMSKYMQVVWLYLIGIAIIFFGLIMLSMKSGPSSFIVMLMGLAVSAIGAAHGRRMRAMGQFDMGPAPKGEDGRQAENKGMTEEEGAPEEMRREERQAPADAGGAGGMNLGSRFVKVMDIFRRGPEGPEVNEEVVDGIEMEDMKRGKIAAVSADVVELVCPKCMAENEDKNVFCFKCGNRLRRKGSKEGDEDRPEIAVEPGTISVVGDRKVAKVMICPKCNLANKVGDKYCWNCGKKIRSDSAVAVSARAQRDAPRVRGIPEIDAIFSQGKQKRGKKRGRRGRARTNLKNADEIKS